MFVQSVASFPSSSATLVSVEAIVRSSRSSSEGCRRAWRGACARGFFTGGGAARLLGISPTAVSTRLHRALGKLEERMRRHDPVA